MKSYKSIFEEQWLSRCVFNGIQHTIADNKEEQHKSELIFLSELVIGLLNRQKAESQDFLDVLSFYGFCQRNVEKSYSQILQDLWVLYMTGEKNNGYFVEFGACDGKTLSNTLLLENNYGWNGILSEPNPVWHQELEQRKCSISHHCVHWETGKSVQFECTEERPELSRLTEVIPDDVHERNGNRSVRSQISAESITLNDLLEAYDAPENIDYISIDTEGSEWEIISAFDFEKWDVSLFTIEHAGETKKREQIQSLLNDNGYTLWNPTLSRWDDWYVKH